MGNGGVLLKTELRSGAKKISLAKPIWDEEMKQAALSALQNEKFVMGESVQAFEEEFANYCGVDYAISTSSGTSAIQLAIVSLGVKPNENVITSPFTFVASANAVLHAGVTPKFADIQPGRVSIDPTSIESNVSSSTRAILPIHLYGHPVDMHGCMEVARRHGLRIVEDACQAHGALWGGKKVGSIGDVGCFSFYPSKNMTVGGDGGMVTTNSEEIAKQVSMLRDCGRVSRYVHTIVGYTSRLNSVNAAIGRVQLKHLNEWNELRRKHAAAYRSNLSKIGQITLPPEDHADEYSVYHLFVIQTPHRDALKVWLEKNGVECGIHYPLPVHLQPVYRELFSYQEGMFPRSEALSKEVLSLPMHPSLTDADVHYVSELIMQYFTEQG